MRLLNRPARAAAPAPSASVRGLAALTPARLLVAGIVVYILAFTWAACYKYNNYQMGFDLGVHEQVLWNTAHGRIAATSAFASTDSYLGIDIIPTELLLAPLYALAPSIYTMLFLQTLALALGAVPVFWLARGRFAHLYAEAGLSSSARLPAWAGLVFALAFLLYLPVEYTNLYEFQIRAFATTFLLLALHAQEQRRFVPFLIWSLLALGCRSEAGLVLACMGLAQLLVPKAERKAIDYRFVIVPIVVGLIWFVLCLELLIPFFRNGEPSLYLSIIYGQIDGQPWLGDSPAAIFHTLLTRPGYVLQEVFGSAARGPMRLRYLLEMFLPFGFLLLLRPRMMLITLPIFGLNLLSNTPNIHASSHYHYQTLIVPFMVIGSAEGLCWLIRALSRARGAAPAERTPQLARWGLAGVLALGVLCNTVIFAPAPFGSRNPALAQLGTALKPSGSQAHDQAVAQLLAQVPPDAALATTNTIGPHAARRERIFFFPGNVIYPSDKIAQAEFLLIDQDDLLQDAKTRAQRQQMLDELASSGRYQRLAEAQNITLWRRVAP